MVEDQNPPAIRLVADRDEWCDATKKLFGKVSCDTLKWTMRLAKLVERALHYERIGPSRDKLRGKLERIIGLSHELADLLDSSAVRSLAPEVGDVLAQHGAEGPQVLSRVVHLAQRRLDGLAGGGGRVSAASTYGQPTAFMQCAAAVNEVWRRRPGRRRAVSTDDTACIACAALWRLAGGPVTQRAQNDPDLPPAMWERHLRNIARRPTQLPTRRQRGEQLKLKSEGRMEVQIGIAQDRAREVLDGSRLQIPRDN